MVRASFPHLRLRQTDDDDGLLELPWELPLADWRHPSFRDLPVGPSRHLVRFLDHGRATLALKEEPLGVARREYAVLRRLRERGLPAVRAIGLAEAPERDSAVLVTEYLPHSLQYRRVLMRAVKDRSRADLLDAMAWLLVDLHRAGVYWGDCSLANTLFRRDGDTIAAYLVDAETSEIHPELSDGQRASDLEILVENVAYGFADLSALQGRDDYKDAIAAAERVRDRYFAVWNELHAAPELSPGDRHAVRARLRRLNDLGFSVEEIELRPGGPGGRVVLQVAVTNRRFHARSLERLTGLVTLENQARLLLNDLREYGAWLEWADGAKLEPSAAAARWLRDVFEATTGQIRAAIGDERDLVQAYCDLLEHKWLLSERAGRDIGLGLALEGYLAAGAPAPESAET